ncbi:MAG: hydroxyacid dehydrogenase [Caldilineaceae bacterium]
MQARKILFLPPKSLAQDILSEKAKNTLESQGVVLWNELDRNYTSDELAELLPGAEAVVTSWGSPLFTPELLAAADSLRIVGHAAGTVKRLMPKAGYDQGIVVLSAAAVIADAVAEYTLWAMLTLQRKLLRYVQLMQAERGWKSTNEDHGHSLYKKKVGIVSASMVGRRVIKLLQPFGCDIMVYDPYLRETDRQTLGVRSVELAELFATGDVISLHAPTTPETHRMIGAAHFQAIRDEAVFINTARTWVLDEAALIAELQTGRFRAILDVFEQEPLPAEHPLRDLPNVYLTPHISGHSVEVRQRLVEEIADDIQAFFAGEPMRLAVPPERLAIMA